MKQPQTAVALIINPYTSLYINIAKLRFPRDLSIAFTVTPKRVSLRNALKNFLGFVPGRSNGV